MKKQILTTAISAAAVLAVLGQDALAGRDNTKRHPKDDHNYASAALATTAPKDLGDQISARPDVDLGVVLEHATNNKETGKALLAAAKKHPHVLDAIMNKSEGDIGFRDNILLLLIEDAELVDMILSDYTESHPKTTASIASFE
ncbi:MAG: hypothetical protein HOI80_04485 [Alphaproteobacteria bacterium]|jgi:hypothetical protein|nr:hypothetical protein [Alphaproteobacteria bacterium]MBT5390301.1 hypothetical protein [Alphaproteobacteria bacterium]MBT5540299.1 hypothetical protein [Alphaproteobacteria bacterium]MBT5654739.1 hypothetical protein [Alphaproteobacteria bacterium]